MLVDYLTHCADAFAQATDRQPVHEHAMGMDGVIFRLRMAGPALAPAVVLETPLEVRAGSPLGKILGGPIEGLTDPAKLWAK